MSDPVWSPDGGALFFRAVNNTTYNETVYRYSVADQKLEPVVRGQESYGRLVAGAGRRGLVGRGRDPPDDLWIFGAQRPAHAASPT